MLVPSGQHFGWRMSDADVRWQLHDTLRIPVEVVRLLPRQSNQDKNVPLRLHMTVSDARDPDGTKLRCPSFLHAASDGRRLTPPRSDRCSADAASA